MAYNLTYKDRTFFLVHEGLITIEEINESNGVMHGHEQFDSHKYQLINLLKADFSEIELWRASQPGATDSVASRTKENVKVAMVVDEEKAIEFCKEYIYTARNFGSKWSFELFTDESSALQWFKT